MPTRELDFLLVHIGVKILINGRLSDCRKARRFSAALAIDRSLDLKQRARLNCLTPERADGHSSHRRFTDAQKQAISQETEKRGASVAQALRDRGGHNAPIATEALRRIAELYGIEADVCGQTPVHPARGVPQSFDAHR